MDIVVYLFAGAIAGLLSGMFGLGGGVIVVPALAFGFSYMGLFPHALMHVAEGTSFAVMMVTTISSAVSHLRAGSLLWPLFSRLIVGIVIGIIVGGVVADLIPSKVLSIFFGVFLMLIFCRMAYTSFIKKRPTIQPEARLPGIGSFAIVTPLIGFCSGLLGTGSGSMFVPYLSYYHYKMKNIAAVSAACSFPIAVIGTITYTLTGLDQTHHAWTTGYVNWKAFLFIGIASLVFAPIGVWVTNYVSSFKMKRGFTVIILFLAIYMLHKGIF